MFAGVLHELNITGVHRAFSLGNLGSPPHKHHPLSPIPRSSPPPTPPPPPTLEHMFPAFELFDKLFVYLLIDLSKITESVAILYASRNSWCKMIRKFQK